MDSRFLPKNLQAEQVLEFAASDYPLEQTNRFSGYRISLMRRGESMEFLGWIELVDGDQDVGYIYIRRKVAAPKLGGSRYVVMDITPDLLDPMLRILQSNEPLQIGFYQRSADDEAVAVLEHQD